MSSTKVCSWVQPLCHYIVVANPCHCHHHSSRRHELLFILHLLPFFFFHFFLVHVCFVFLYKGDDCHCVSQHFLPLKPPKLKVGKVWCPWSYFRVGQLKCWMFSDASSISRHFANCHKGTWWRWWCWWKRWWTTLITCSTVTLEKSLIEL